MRAIFIAMLLALGLGFAGTSASSAAPTIGGLQAIQDAVEGSSPVVSVRWHCRRHHVRHSRWRRVCRRWF